MRFVNAAHIGVRPVLWEYDELLLIHRPTQGNHRTTGYGSLTEDAATRIHEGLLRLGFTDEEAQTYWVNGHQCEDVDVSPDDMLSVVYGPVTLSHDVTVRRFTEVMEHVHDEVGVGTVITHRDFQRPVTVVLLNPPGHTGYYLVHAPAGSRTSGAAGWRLDTNLPAAAVDEVRENMTRLGIEWASDTATDGFWLVRPDSITIAGAVEPTDESDPETEFEVFTMHPSWNTCLARNRGEVSHDEHMIVAERDGYVYYQCLPGNQHQQAPVEYPEIREQMRAKGIDPMNRDWQTVSRPGVSERRRLRRSEVGPFMQRFRQPLPNTGWGQFTAAVYEAGQITWRPATWVTGAEVYVLYREDDVPEGVSVSDAGPFSNHQTYAERFGFEGALKWRGVPSSQVVGFLPYPQMGFVLDRVTTSETKSNALRVLNQLDEQRAQFVEVLTAGGRRLGLGEDEVAKFIEETDLGPLTKYRLSANIEVTGTVTMTQDVEAVDEASALRMWQTPDRGEATITIPRSDRIRVEGHPTVRQIA